MQVEISRSLADWDVTGPEACLDVCCLVSRDASESLQKGVWIGWTGS